MTSVGLQNINFLHFITIIITVPRRLRLHVFKIDASDIHRDSADWINTRIDHWYACMLLKYLTSHVQYIYVYLDVFHRRSMVYTCRYSIQGLHVTMLGNPDIISGALKSPNARALTPTRCTVTVKASNAVTTRIMLSDSSCRRTWASWALDRPANGAAWLSMT